MSAEARLIQQPGRLGHDVLNKDHLQWPHMQIKGSSTNVLLSFIHLMYEIGPGCRFGQKKNRVINNYCK